jgi:hypothetical protein
MNRSEPLSTCQTVIKIKKLNTISIYLSYLFTFTIYLVIVETDLTSSIISITRAIISFSSGICALLMH